MLLKVGSVVGNCLFFLHLSLFFFAKTDKLVSDIKRSARGLIFVVVETKTQQKYVLKSIVAEDAKKADLKKMMETWKALNKSEAKDFIVSHVEHFYSGKNASLFVVFNS
jgi:hypothetical protein